MAASFEQDRERGWYIPDVYLQLDGRPEERVAALVAYWWGNFSPTWRGALVGRLLSILQPNGAEAPVTDAMRDRCGLAVQRWVQRYARTESHRLITDAT